MSAATVIPHVVAPRVQANTYEGCRATHLGFKQRLSSSSPQIQKRGAPAPAPARGRFRSNLTTTVAASSNGAHPRIAAAVADAEQLMAAAGGVLGGGEARRVRFDVAQQHLDEDVHGSYGEFPLVGMMHLLEHPAVHAVLTAAEQGDIVAGAEGSIDDAESISRAAAFFQDCDGDDPDAACYPESTANPFQPSLVDVGSGAGRLVLAAATMRSWRSVAGIEASKTLAGLGHAAIAKLEQEGAVAKGVMRSIHADANLGGGEVDCFVDASCEYDPAGDGAGGALAEAASVLAGADIAIAYSTAFPSPDGLRLLNPKPSIQLSKPLILIPKP